MYGFFCHLRMPYVNQIRLRGDGLRKFIGTVKFGNAEGMSLFLIKSEVTKMAVR